MTQATWSQHARGRKLFFSPRIRYKVLFGSYCLAHVLDQFYALRGHECPICTCICNLLGVTYHLMISYVNVTKSAYLYVAVIRFGTAFEFCSPVSQCICLPVLDLIYFAVVVASYKDKGARP